ncbi:MAG TPA: GTPase Era [Candidatus Sumerlaeota bacterium]|nr:GTPase Era [Candidatus Sumerlaeota bacterium]HRR30381.1 GTPase Era [Candidatus Sumerlaeia bacterium]HON51122.1 GTPase Era [Candidatus Sumerlaeota bacterium]HOR64999.1 GTPase Era [Candidatus Sumerlaeota bacterium]HPL74989.1 GTPase Era [Candidatus Sumerlaeota bacterium]
MISSKHKPFQSGFVAILGKPNAGKSTLLNSLIGEKLAIVSPKPQTTRNIVLGILSSEDFQIIFVDTPGIIEPKNLINKCLIESAETALEDVDLIYHITDVTDPKPVNASVQRLLGKSKSPRFLIANKIDLLQRPFNIEECPNLPDVSRYERIIAVSALTGYNVPELLKETLAYIPEGPLYYDPEQISDRDLRFLSSEIVREKTFELLGEELPYSVAVEIEEFKERETGKWFIRAVIYVERDSQKAIVIGRNGAMLKQIGSLARPAIEQLVGCPIYLELWVKVRKNWTKNEQELRRLGYFSPKKKKK